MSADVGAESAGFAEGYALYSDLEGKSVDVEGGVYGESSKGTSSKFRSAG